METVAAGCHILYSITHSEALKGPPVIDLEVQLNPNHPNYLAAKNVDGKGMGVGIDPRGGAAANTGTGKQLMIAGPKTVGGAKDVKDPKLKGRSAPADSNADAATLASVLRRHTARKDVARACVRSIMNLTKYPTALASLIAAGVLEPMFMAVSLHPSARDITEGTVNMLKLTHKAKNEQQGSNGSQKQAQSRADLARAGGLRPDSSSGLAAANRISSGAGSAVDLTLPPNCVTGMLTCVKARPGDAVSASIIFNQLESMVTMHGVSSGLRVRLRLRVGQVRERGRG